ncbi:MAG TPA: GyrI-like domain-containing protein [Rhizomicrobium sp.]|nr:GyrI-like domain-containing protein [Rhizomicrobium sp.]
MEFAVEHSPEQPLAAIVERIAMNEIGARAMVNLDRLQAFLKRHEDLRLPGGHNVFVYRGKDRPPPDGRTAVDFAVQVSRTFAGADGIACTSTPAGRVATARHIGPYHLLARTHAAVQNWAHANGHRLAGTDWEIYGDWNDDPAKLETRVCYLLAP